MICNLFQLYAHLMSGVGVVQPIVAQLNLFLQMSRLVWSSESLEDDVCELSVAFFGAMVG